MFPTTNAILIQRQVGFSRLSIFIKLFLPQSQFF